MVNDTTHYRAKPIGETLMRYGRDLTSMAKASQLDPIIGREGEVDKLLQILARRHRVNPVLTGPSGVGKTAVMHALAQRIVKGDVPENLKKVRVAILDANSVICGTRVNSSFLQRMMSVAGDIESHVIVFIDELQVLIQMGKDESNGGNVLKPFLADGTLHFVGALTNFNFAKYIESDPSLSCHFQQVAVEEATIEKTVDILKVLRPRLEGHHHVTLLDEALVTASTLSSRFLSDRYLPEKAITLIDTAAAQVSLKLDTKPDTIKNLDKVITALKAETEILRKDISNHSLVVKNETEIRNKQEILDNLTQSWNDSRTTKESRKELLKQIEETRRELIVAESSSNALMTLEYKTKLTSLESLLNNSSEEDGSKRAVTTKDIMAAVALVTGIPMNSLVAAEKDRVLHLEHALRSKIIGQDEAVQSISNAIRISRAGLHAFGRPLGSFLFLGPTGVGKTQLCRVLAQELFNDANAMIRIDMSEYMEKFSVSRLIGAPPGYVGYEEGGTLTEAVRRCPSSLILFDEFEKAHREVSNLLLQLLDAGHLTDSKGRKVDFSNTLVIMTSNLGSDILSALPENHTSSEAKDKVMDTVKSNFSPEFLNRIDEIIIFNRLNHRDITLSLSATARTWIADKGYDRIYGARPLKRVLQRWLLNPLASLMLSGEVSNGCTVLVDVRQDQLHVSKEKK